MKQLPNDFDVLFNKKTLNDLIEIFKLYDINLEINNITPFEFYLKRYQFQETNKLLEIINFFISNKAVITNNIKKLIISLNQSFDLFKEQMDLNDVVKLEEDYNKINKLINIKEIPKEIKHDNISDIILKEDDWYNQFNYLVNYLVTPREKSVTMQSQIINIAIRLNYEEAKNNNKNNIYKEMLKQYRFIITQGNSLPIKEIEEIKKIEVPNDEDIYLLCKYATKWVSLNKKIINNIGE